MMTLNFNQLALMIGLFILYTMILYILIYRKFNRFLMDQQNIHLQALKTGFQHHEESSLSDQDKLDS